jgi:hypothetical protein
LLTKEKKKGTKGVSGQRGVPSTLPGFTLDPQALRACSLLAP